MSGEQAEERTAREGRIDKQALGNSLLESLREDGYTEANIVYQQTLALLSECSRLASRVEELDKLIAFKGYGAADSLVLGCGHGKWSSKGDCITCLSFAIDSLNKTLAEERIARSTAETKL